MLGIIYLVLAIFIVFPMIAIVIEGFWGRDAVALAEVIPLLTSPEVAQALGNTITISLAAVAIAALFGVGLAWFMARSNMPGKSWFDPLNLIPFYLSSVVGAMSWQVIAAPRTGLLNSMLAPLLGGPLVNIYSIWGIGFVLGLFYTPYIYIFTLNSLQKMDPALEEASRMSGASHFQTAMRVTLPLAAPAILSAALLVFVTAAGIFGVPLLLGGPGRIQTLSTLIFKYVTDYPANYGAAAILSGTLLVFTFILVALQFMVLRRRSFTTVTGKGYRPKLVDLGNWRWLGVGFNALFLLFILAPFVALVAVSFQDTWTGTFQWSRITLDNYYQVFFIDATAKRGFINSMIISPIGATIGVALSLLLALVVQRTRLPGRQGIVPLALMPVTIPGIVLGTGFLVAFVTTPLYGTLTIIMIAYIVNYLPTGLRNMEALIGAVSRDLDESARTSGATWLQSMRKIIIPLVTPGLISTWLLLFVTFIREVSASMMLFTFGTETMSIALIRILDYQAYGVSGAFGVLQTVLLLFCAVLIRMFSSIDETKKQRN